MKVTLVHWLLASLSLMITAYLVPGVHVNSFFSALIASVIIGLVNITVWPLLIFFTLPLTILTFGLFLFVVNGLALWIAAAFSPGFAINGIFPAIIGSIVLTIVGAIIRHLFKSTRNTPKQP